MRLEHILETFKLFALAALVLVSIFQAGIVSTSLVGAPSVAVGVMATAPDL